MQEIQDSIQHAHSPGKTSARDRRGPERPAAGRGASNRVFTQTICAFAQAITSVAGDVAHSALRDRGANFRAAHCAGPRQTPLSRDRCIQPDGPSRRRPGRRRRPYLRGGPRGFAGANIEPAVVRRTAAVAFCNEFMGFSGFSFVVGGRLRDVRRWNMGLRGCIDNTRWGAGLEI